MDNIKVFNPAEFGKTLKELRNSKGLTQKELGDKIYVDQSVISSYEKGSRMQSIGADNLMKLAQALDTTMDHLCGLNPDEREITASQWFAYTVKLLNDPPSYLYPNIPAPEENEPPNHSVLPLVKAENGENVSIVFSGKDMRMFFNAYFALKESMCGNIDESTYNNLIKTLFDSYSQFFTVGWRGKGNYHDGMTREGMGKNG